MKRLAYFPIFFVLLMVGCSTIVRSVTNDLTEGILQQNDIALVKEAAPAYLLILESLIYKNPTNRDYLMTGVQLYSTYSSAFVEDELRRELFAKKVVEWGNNLLLSYPLYHLYAHTDSLDRELKEKRLEAFVKSIKKKDIPYVFWGVFAIGMDAINNSDNPLGLLMLPMLLRIVDKIYELDHSFFNGAPHLFYGLYYGTYPEAFGGDPARAKKEFEEAINISKGNLLSTKIMFAQVYYKNQYNREGYEKLLKEVLDFDIDSAKEYRLMNSMAQEQARALLDEIDDYFFKN